MFIRKVQSQNIVNNQINGEGDHIGKKGQEELSKGMIT
jgi:hypothetical protein